MKSGIIACYYKSINTEFNGKQANEINLELIKLYGYQYSLTSD